MRIGILASGWPGVADQTVVLEVRPEHQHRYVVQRALEEFGLPIGGWAEAVASELTLWPSEGGGPGFPPQEPIGDIVATVNPFRRTVSPADYDAVIEVGRYFGFCRASEAADAGFLEWLGFPTPPSIVPRFGKPQEGPDRHVDPFSILAPRFQCVAAVSTDRLVYKPGQRVALFALALRPREAAADEARLKLVSAGAAVPGTEREVEFRSGLGVAHFEDLPEGHYTAELSWEGEAAECSFTVGQFARSAAQAVWEDGPRIEREDWVGSVRLSLYGVPLPAGVAIDCSLATEEPPTPPTVALTPKEGGRLPFRLPNTHPECRVVAFHWRDGVEHSAQLPLPGAEEFEAELGVRAMAAPHEGSTRAAGLHVSLRLDEACPLRLRSAAAHRITLEATRDLDATAVTVLFPDEDPATHTTGPLRRGQEIGIELPSRCGYGFLCVAAMAGDECFEAAAPLFAPTELEVRCEVPEVVRAGKKASLAIEVNDQRPTPVAVIVRDARMHSGGGLEAAGASARLEALREEWNQESSQRGIDHPLSGPPPGRFSDCYLAGTFALDARPGRGLFAGPGNLPYSLGASMVTGPEARLALSQRALFDAEMESTVDNMMAYAEPIPAPLASPMPGETGAEPVPLAAAAAVGPMPQAAVRRAAPPPPEAAEERVDMLFADLVVVERGRLEIEIDVPSVPAGYTVDLLAVDAQYLGLTTHQATFRARRAVEVHADTLPACVHPSDAGHVRATVAVVTTGEQLELSVSRNGEPVAVTLADGTLVSGGLECVPGAATEFVLPLAPGIYQFIASSEGGSHVAEALVHPADRISERVRRLVVLEPGETFEPGTFGHIFDLRLVGDPEEIFRRCGQAVADYSHACCEQTASKMLGAWLALAPCVPPLTGGPRGGDDEARFKAIGTLRHGAERLESMWRPGGFAMYPDQSHPHDYWGPGAYRHLVGMRPLRRLLGDAPGLNGDVGALTERIEAITAGAAGVYGPAPAGAVQSCHDAWLAFAERPAEALEFIRGRWEHVEGPRGTRGQAPGDDGGVALRAETCYAAAVLASDEGERRARHVELVGTLNWLGDQMKGAGRLYSTVDSGALLAFLAAARAYGLMSSGTVRLDDSEPMPTAEANRLIRDTRPQVIVCTEGQAQLFVDGLFEQLVPAGAAGESISVGLELDGRPCHEVAVGSTVDLRIDGGQYRAGMVAHVSLPPSLAFEEGGVRLQKFQRDFAGRDHLRIPCRAIAPTGERPQHGMVLIRNMFAEEDLAPIAIEVRVQNS